MRSSRDQVVPFSACVSYSQQVLVCEEVSWTVALKSNDDNDSSDNNDKVVRILCWVIWWQLIKTLKEFYSHQFMFISSLYFWVKQLSLSLARWKVYLGGLSFLDLTLFTEQVKLKSTHNLYNFCKISYTL